MAPVRTTYRGVRVLWCADALLALLTQLRNTTSVADLGVLRTKIATLLADFQAAAKAEGLQPSATASASEFLATLADHVVNSMPWGADAGWIALNDPGSGAGGRRPHRLLDIASAASSDPDLNELIAVGLLLGFDKRSYGADDRQVEQVMAQLVPPPDPDGVSVVEVAPAPADRRKAMLAKAFAGWLPVWVSALAVTAFLAALFFGLEFSLAVKSDKVYARVAGLNGPVVTASRPEPALTPRLAGPLSGEVAARNVFVLDEVDRSVVVIPAARLFETGSPVLRVGSADFLRPIAAALRQAPGRIRIIGHTDGDVARSARYPSEWEFSVDRARAVHAALRDLGIDAPRLLYDGRANIEPLAPGDGARAVSGNDRIEIVLLAGR